MRPCAHTEQYVIDSDVLSVYFLQTLMVVTTYTPEQTRSELLNAAFREIWLNGFRSASLDSILAKTGVTKGALYHHFKNKTELGYAVVDEIVRHRVVTRWIEPLAAAKNPLDWLINFRNELTDAQLKEYRDFGCPLNNLAQELSSVDEGFRVRIDAIYKEWFDSTTHALERGRREGLVRDNFDARNTAIFIVALFEGAVGLAKNANSTEILTPCFEALIHYLEALRPRRSFRT